MTTYSVTIQASQETLNYLQLNGYSLYAFKGVIASNPGATPSVWFKMTPNGEYFKTVTNIQWENPLYIGSCGTTTTLGGTVITGISPWPKAPGQPVALANAYTYTTSGWEQNSQPGPDPNSFTIYNHISKGISMYCVSSKLITTGKESPIIVVDSVPDGSINFSPVEVVAFIFAQQKYDAGTLIAQAFSGGCIVTLAGANTEAIITYDPNGDGWAPAEGYQSQFSRFQSGTNLYNAMTRMSFQAHRALLEPFNAYLGVENPGWCACDEHGVSHNKCKPGYKPACISDGPGVYDCECVQR